MGKTLGRVAYEIWMDRAVPDEHWNERPGYAKQLWEAIAAAVAAEVRREMGWRPIEEAPEQVKLFVGKWWLRSEWITVKWTKAEAVDFGYTHYLPQPDPPPQEPTR